MKYYHLIYNSSQRTQDGSAGLGIRTYTKGMPQEYMDLLNENEFFNYSSGNLTQPSPKVLLEDGKIILDYPATYRFAKLFSATTGKDIYVLSRTVTVGFDYPYYVKFAASRVDNFVTDVYVFEVFPADQVFEILYENPASGSQCFVPRDRVPSPTNDEMRILSLGEMALLEEEEKPFACQKIGLVSEQAFELLFAFIDSCRLRQPLLVKCPATDAPTLIAELIRLLPPEMRKETFFYTNYQLEGVKEGYKVFFINEHYKYDYENTGQYYVFDITRNAKVGTDESGTYRDEWIRLVHDGNKDDYLKRLNWVLSPDYDMVRGKSDATKHLFFDYTIDPASFNFNLVFKGDDELLTILRDYFAKDRRHQQLFDKQLGAYLISDRIKGSDLLSLLKFVERLESKGFILNEPVAHSKKAVSAKLLETPETLKTALDGLGIEKLDKYIDKQVFEGKKTLLEADELKKEWPKIYKYFYPVSEQNNHVKIMSKMFGLNLSEAVVDEVVKGFGIGDLQLCDCLAEVAKRDASEIDIPYKRIKDILDNQERKHLELPNPDLAEKIDKYVLSPLMNDPERPNGIESCQELMQLLGGKFNEQNAAALVERALKIGTGQSVSLLFYKGLPYIKGNDVDAFVNQLVDNVKHEKTEFYGKVNGHPFKLQLLAAYFVKNGDSKKSIEKLRKEGKLNLTNDEYEDLLRKLASPSKRHDNNDNSDTPNKMKAWLKGLIASAVVVLLLAGYFVLFHHPSSEVAVLKLEAFIPEGNVDVKDVINGITADSQVPENAKVGYIYADKIAGQDNISYFKVVAVKQEAEPVKVQMPESQMETKEQMQADTSDKQQNEVQQPQDQTSEKQSEEVG